MQHAVGLLHIKAAAGARLGQTLGGQHLVGGVHRVDADALLRSHRAAARQRRSGCALAGADLIRQGGVQLLIQRRFLVGAAISSARAATTNSSSHIVAVDIVSYTSIDIFLPGRYVFIILISGSE